MTDLTFPPYTLTGGVAWRELSDRDVFDPGDQLLGAESVGWANVAEPCFGETVKWFPLVGFRFRRPLAPTPENYALLQAAWLSHFHVGVGSRVRCINDVDTVWNSLGFTAEFPRGVSVIEFHSKCQWPELIITGIEPHGIRCKDCSWLFPFHVLAPVAEQPKVEVIELTEETRHPSITNDITHLVLVDAPKPGDRFNGFVRHKHGQVKQKWFLVPGDYAEVAGVIELYEYARAAEPHEHPPAVPEGQGDNGLRFDRRRLEIIRAAKEFAESTTPESPTPTIERGEEGFQERVNLETLDGPGAEFVLRHLQQYSRCSWDVLGFREALTSEQLERVRVIWAAWKLKGDVPTPTPSAGQEEDDRFIEEEQTVLRLHDKEVTARWVDGVRSELGGDGSLVYLVRLLQKELADLRRQVADDDRLQCCNGCRHYTGGDVRHHPSCKWYPESLTKIQDDQQAELTRLRGEVERLASIKRLLLHVLNGMMEVETNDWVVQQAATAISNAAMIDRGTYRPGSFMPTGSEGGVE